MDATGSGLNSTDVATSVLHPHHHHHHHPHLHSHHHHLHHHHHLASVMQSNTPPTPNNVPPSSNVTPSQAPAQPPPSVTSQHNSQPPNGNSSSAYSNQYEQTNQYVDTSGQFCQYDPYYHSYYHTNTPYQHDQHVTSEHHQQQQQQHHNIAQQSQHSNPPPYNPNPSEFYPNPPAPSQPPPNYSLLYSAPHPDPVTHPVNQQVQPSQDVEFQDVSFRLFPLLSLLFILYLFFSGTSLDQKT